VSGLHMPAGAGTQWVQPLRQASQQPPQAPRWPLWCNGQRIGSVAEAVFDAAQATVWARQQGFVLEAATVQGAQAWQLQADDPTAALNAMAQLLRTQGRCGPWRNEQLDVHGQDGALVATVERGAVRVLGVATQAVHLLGSAPDGRMWVQQRALNKPTHPGKWDTLMGGMVSAGDSLQTALARETQEEAGLDLAPLQQLRRGGQVDFACPSEEGGDGTGYMLESIQWFHAVVPQGVQPQNMDGEVAQFQCITPQQLQAWLLQDCFTPEASLILADHLGW